MTIEEKKAAIRNHCAGRRCSDCELGTYNPNVCFSKGADIERNYAILFGEEITTIRPKEVSDNGMQRWVCECGNLMYKKQKYCDECGQEFNWED